MKMSKATKPLTDKNGEVRELTAADIRRMRPASKVVPGVVAAWKRTRGRPKSETPKIATSIRLDADLLAHFKATGTGWQTRINQVLRKAVGM
ncbi:MAG: BrnA antitoxin family protein [Alphaproteobacteria bacterium]|nr:BrnA antitoxin family protein [Alphaproteobacteria bacterium]